MEPRMESCLAQVLQKDVGKRLQVGQELIDYFSDKQKSADLEHDQTMLDKLVDGLATSWVNSSNYKVAAVRGLLVDRNTRLSRALTLSAGRSGFHGPDQPDMNSQ
uniref:Cytoplasmic linker associated protein 1 n=1 Tax=Equus caballus TaxID=9796 RepID=A0A9L0SHZ2_HORSE|nr:CLIP-associating protein 1-like [Equus caballus]